MFTRVRSWGSVVASLLLLLAMQACETVDGPTSDLDPTIRSFADGDNTAPAVVHFEARHAADDVVAYEWYVDGQPRDAFGPGMDAYFAQAGTHEVSVTIVDERGNEATTRTTVDIQDADSPFTIDVRFFDDEGMTLSERRAFSAAARRWAEVIHSDFEPFPVNKASNACRAGEPSFSGTVDDIVIFASIASIDGRDGILAQAGPCATDADGFPVYGVMQFDEVDLPRLSDNADLEGVILHEMGHVLGFGTLWDLAEPPLLDPPECIGAVDPRYVGANAVREWEEYGGTDAVPVQEGETEDGTACGHWREQTTRHDLFNELMTGMLDASMDLSRITIGAMDDLGYSVDYEAADPFDLFPALTSLRGDEREPLDDRLLFPTTTFPVER